MRRIRILRIITRLNTGGPAVHLATLAGALDPARYEQWLVTGREGPGEGSMRPLVERRGVHPIVIPEMVGTPRLGPRDVAALMKIRRLIHDLRPDIVETHLSKAGILGRLAARLEHVPAVVHIFHGHVLDRYFGPLKTWMARRTERALAGFSHRLVAVSALVRQELVNHRVAPADRIAVIELGLELDPLLHCRAARGLLRRELGIPAEAPLVGIVGRLSRIKNHELFLDAAAGVASQLPEVRFLVVGDGERRSALEVRARRLGLTRQVLFAGWRSDLPGVYADLDALALSSDNEGTPLVLIEAMAAGCPTVATAVGGVPDLIEDGVSGLLVPPGQPGRLADALVRLLCDRRLAAALAAEAQTRARTRFGVERLAADMDALYRDIVTEGR
jgi:glycosyltransferase involved in cell wall biosynthesis